MYLYSNPTDYTWKAILAEFIGTFALVFIIGAAVVVGYQGIESQSLTALAASLFAALGLVSIFFTFGWFSGAHLNPAVSIGFWVSGRMNFWLMLAYVATQLVAGIAAAALIAYIFPNGANKSASVGYLTSSDSWKAVLVEAFLAFFLTLTILSVTANPVLAATSGIFIGFALGALMFAGFSLTGGSMNPARSLGPAIFTNNLGTIWVYFVGPIIGAIVAGLIYRLFMTDFSCCTLKDECGEAVLDRCGNEILQCQRPCIDSCGNPMVDECGEAVMETYEKRKTYLNHMQQTPLDAANQLAASRGISGIYFARQFEKGLDVAAHNLDKMLHEKECAETHDHSESVSHHTDEIKITHAEGKLKLKGSYDEISVPTSTLKSGVDRLSSFAPVVQKTEVAYPSSLSGFKASALAPSVLSQ